MNFAILNIILKEKDRWIILAALLACMAIAVYLFMKPYTYQSSIIFYYDDDQESGLKLKPNEENIILSKASNGNRIFHLTRSTQMLQFSECSATKKQIYKSRNLPGNNHLEGKKRMIGIINS